MIPTEIIKILYEMWKILSLNCKTLRKKIEDMENFSGFIDQKN